MQLKLRAVESNSKWWRKRVGSTLIKQLSWNSTIYALFVHTSTYSVGKVLSWRQSKLTPGAGTPGLLTLSLLMNTAELHCFSKENWDPAQDHRRWWYRYTPLTPSELLASHFLSLSPWTALCHFGCVTSNKDEKLDRSLGPQSARRLRPLPPWAWRRPSFSLTKQNRI